MNDDAKSPSTGGMGQCIQKTSPNDQEGALGQSKKHKRIVPLSLMNKAQAAHFFITESVAVYVAIALIVGGHYGL